jgi:serine acetyltransferase
MLKRIIVFIFSLPTRVLTKVLPIIPYFKFLKETQNTQTPISLSIWYKQKILGYNRKAYWPMHFTSKFSGYWQNVYCGIETCPGYSSGNYIQAIGKIYIGDYTQIAPNVGIISANHDIHDSRKYETKEVRIGKYCWIGMGSMILPGVTLGDFTIVGAGAIVTKSFEEGYCVIGGNPARIIKKLDQNLCITFKSDFEYNGYVKSDKFSTSLLPSLQIK